MPKLKPNSQFLYDSTTDDIVGVKDADGGERRFVYTDGSQGDVTITGNLTVNGDLALGDDITITDTLTVNGVTTLASTTDSTTKDNGALVVEGGVGIEKRLNVGGQVSALATTASSSTTTGALVVSGGLGVAGAAHIGGNTTLAGYTEGVVAIGTVGASHTFALTSGTVQTATLTASTATTFTMPTATAGKSFTLFLKQAASTGNGTATFTDVKWNATTPVVTATAGKMDIFTFVADGTNWYGSVIQGFTP